MANLKFIGMQAGSAAPHIGVLPIATTEDIDAGTIIAIGPNRKLTTNISENNPEILGTVAVDYKCKKDDFNPENGSGKIKVNLSQGSVYSMPLPEITEEYDSSTGVITIAETSFAGSGGKFANSHVVFVSKGENSNSTIKEGEVFTIESTTNSSGRLVLTLAEEVAIGKGDKFRIVPFIGVDSLCVSGTDLILASSGPSVAKVIGNDKEMKNAYIVLNKAFLA